MLNKILIFFVIFSFSIVSKTIKAASDKIELIEQNWPHSGIFGRFDKSSLQRGFLVYKEVCAACHGLKHVSYRDLTGIGLTVDEIKSIAGEYELVDGPNDEGEMFDREAKPSDKFVNPYENDNQARVANNGAYPPDLSLIVKARAGGADYLYHDHYGPDHYLFSDLGGAIEHSYTSEDGYLHYLEPVLDPLIDYADGVIHDIES